jgi:hypothetical protein
MVLRLRAYEISDRVETTDGAGWAVEANEIDARMPHQPGDVFVAWDSGARAWWTPPTIDDEWPDDPYYARIAADCREAGISREQWEAHQREAVEQASRDPKAPTWGLALLYPVSAFMIWVGLWPPSLRMGAFAQSLLIAIAGVWIGWVSIRLVIRERYKYRTWVHYALMALGLVGFVFVMLAVVQIHEMD